jgi:hypothetical protein
MTGIRAPASVPLVRRTTAYGALPPPAARLKPSGSVPSLG